MKTRKVLLILSLLVSMDAFSQDWQWSKDSGGIKNDAGNSIAVDAAGNVYVTGYFNNTISFDPTHTLLSMGHADIFLVKYSPTGDVIWAEQAGGYSDDRATGICISALNRVCVTGYFVGTAYFGNSMNTFTVSSGGRDIFIADYDTSGNFLHVIRTGGGDNDISNSIATHGAGDLYITGTFSSTAIFGNTTLISSGGTDVFIAKYNQNFILQWAIKAGGAHSDAGTSIGVNGSGEVYVTGYFNGGNNFAGDILFDNNNIDLTSYGQTDMFLVKYDPNGNFIWATNGGGMNYDSGNCLAVNFYGECYVTGYFSATGYFGNDSLMTSGWKNMFVAKYDPLGNCVWAAQSGGMYAHDAGSAIYADAAGNSYVAGNFSDTVSFGISTLISAGGYDAFVSKYDPVGNCLWGKSGGSAIDDFGMSVAGDAAGNVYVTGYFNNSPMSFDTMIISNHGMTDMFLAKLSNAPTGIADALTFDERVIVYPNPFTESATVSFSNDCVHHLTLYDLSGREVQFAEGAKEIRISGNDLPTGIYLYRAIDAEGKVVAQGKVVIE